MSLSELGINSFPKIYGKASGLIKSLEKLDGQGKLPQSIFNMEGTVKLHGMHADIVFNLRSSSINFQSRNRLCDPNVPNQTKWPSNIAKHGNHLQDLKERITTRFQLKCPDQILDRTKPLIIAGEWIGPKIQKDVGVSKLSHRFVIIGIQINNIWQEDALFADIEAPEADIYNVLRVPQYIVKFDTKDLSMANPAFLEMQKIADEVEACCPFAGAFGASNSRGEGVVWKPGFPEARGDANYWLKTKGPILGPENRIGASINSQEGEQKLNFKDAARRWVTPRRLEQGFEYLQEMQVDKKEQKKAFINWVVSDVLTEEAGEIERMKLMQPECEGMIIKQITVQAAQGFNNKNRERV